MALPFLATGTQQQATDIRETTAQAESRVQNEQLLGRIGETLGGLTPVIAGTVAGVFSQSPFFGLATGFVADKIKQANRDKAERRKQKRLENRQRREAANILVAQGKVANKREALAMIDEGILRNAEKAEQQRQENLLSSFDIGETQKDTEQQREENTQTERDNLETRVENAEIERETLQGMGAGLALESTATNIDNNISAIGDLILDRFADQEKNEEDQKQLQKQQLIQQREMRLEAERTQERQEEGEPEKVKDDNGGSGLMRVLPLLLAGLTSLVSLVGGVTTSLMGTAKTVLGVGGAAAAAATAGALKKAPTPTTQGAPKKAPTEMKKAPGALSETKETMGDKATKQSPKKGGIGDTIKKFKRVAKKVGFKRLALLIGKRVGTTVAAGLFTGPFAIIVGLIGIGLTVYEISNILDDIDKEFEEGKSVDAPEPKDVSSAELAKMSPEEAKKAGLIDFADQDDLNDRVEELRMKEQATGEPDPVETKQEFIKRRTEEILESGEADARLGSNRSIEASRRKARLMAQAEYVQREPRTGEAITTASRQQSGGAQSANIVDARTTQSTSNQVNNTSTTVKSAPLNPKNQDISSRYSSRYN